MGVSKKYLSFLTILLFLSLVPLSFAHAIGWSDIVDAIKKPFEVAGGVVGNIFDYIVLLPAKVVVAAICFGLFIVALGASLLFFLISGIISEFIKGTLSMPVIPGRGVAVVDIGWMFCRDFANMFIILILAFIGLATILKLREYEAKKILPSLILVALLINFSPVLVGFVVDMGNLITKFFIDRFSFSGENLRRYAWDIPFNYFKNSILDMFTKWGDIREQAGVIIGTILYGLAIFLFNGFGVLILFLVMLIFFLRVIMLWVLSIVSPIAFLSRALPPTPTVKKIFPSIFHWDEWWEKLLQWTIIGIPVGFSLILSSVIFTSGQIFSDKLPSTLNAPSDINFEGSISGLSAFLAGIFAPFAGLVIMGLGVLIGIKTSPSAAAGILGFAKSGMTFVGNWAKTQAARRFGAPLAEKTAAGLRTAARWGERVERRVPVVGAPFKWVARGTEAVLAPALYEYAAKQRKVTIPAGWKQMAIPDKVNYINSLLLDSDKLVLAREMIDEGTFQKTGEPFQGNILEIAKKYASDPRFKREVGDIMYSLCDKITKEMKLAFEAPEKRGEIEKKIRGIMDRYKLKDENEAAAILHIRGMKPQDISKVTKDSAKTDVFRLALRGMGPSHLRALADAFDAETVRSILDEGKGLNTLTEAEIAEIERENPSLVRWAYENPAGRGTLNWSTKWPRKPAPPQPPTPPSPKEGREGFIGGVGPGG
jgi:hypothetical protein